MTRTRRSSTFFARSPPSRSRSLLSCCAAARLEHDLVDLPRLQLDEQVLESLAPLPLLAHGAVRQVDHDQELRVLQAREDLHQAPSPRTALAVPADLLLPWPQQLAQDVPRLLQRVLGDERGGQQVDPRVLA